MDVNLIENAPEEQTIKPKKCKNPNLLVFLQYIIIILIVVFLILVSILYYFSFAGILSLTVYLLLYEWLSLFTKDIIHMVFSILSNFSDFGLFFVLSLLCVYVIKAYFSFAKLGFKILLPIFRNKTPISQDTDENTFFNCVLVCNLIFLCFVQAGLIVLFVFIFKNQVRLFYAAISLECIFLILVFLGNVCKLIQKNKFKCEKKKKNELSASLITPEEAPYFIDNNQNEKGQIEEGQISDIQNQNNNGQNNNDQNSNGQINNGQFPEGQTNSSQNQNGQFSEGQFHDGQIDNDQNQKGQFPDGQNQKGQFHDGQNLGAQSSDSDRICNENFDAKNSRKSSLSMLGDFIRRKSSSLIGVQIETNEHDNKNEVINDDDSDFQQLKNENILFVSSLSGMFDDTNDDTNNCCQNCNRVYQFIIMSIILSLQLYSLIYPCMEGMITIGHFFLYFFIKLIFMNKIFAYNLIDIILNGKRVIRSLKQFKAKLIFWIVIILYILLFLSFIIIFVLTRMTVFPTVKSATFSEKNDRWFKLNNNQTISPDGFCYVTSQKDGSLKTEDFAMLTTLPRMYSINSDGKCFIKPSMRGLFNSTMKYIFGKNYEKSDNIYILCKKLTHYPILVLSSDKILNKTIEYFKNDRNATFLKKQFDGIKNKNYFDNFSTENISAEGDQLLIEYKNCVSENGTENCEDKWDLFSQFYWPNLFNDSYIEIPGFERYQININKEMKIQPSFITNDGKFWAGTHYIISGSYEDSWGVGLFIETIGRKYIPYIFNNFLILYTLIRSIAKEVFLRIEWFNKNIFYCDASSTKEMESIADLLNQFNFSHQSLYTIGHSISGTAFKGVSYFTDIQGITFEASDGENNANLLLNYDFIKNGNSVSQMANVYSKNTIFTGNDQTCDTNGILPKRYLLPSVYDTACMTAITCSETMKYVPFCRQVLTQNGKNPEKEFNISFNAFLNYYGYL